MTPFLKLSISFSMKCFDIHTHHVPLSPEYVIRSIAVGRDVMDAHAVHLSVGIHPWFLTEDNVDQLLFTLRQSLGDERVVALGEAGLDKLRGEAMTIQTTVFRLLKWVRSRLTCFLGVFRAFVSLCPGKIRNL